MDAVSNSMKAVQYSKYDGGVPDLKLVELPIPTPKKGEILIRIEAASINPIDWKIQRGYMRYVIPRKFPHIPGSDVAGEVVDCGEGVIGYNKGDKVVAWVDLMVGGGFATYAVAEVKYSAKLPQEVTAVDAAGLPVAGLSALHSLRDTAGIKIDGSYSGKILVTAASGGVGTFAVQLAKLAGAYVTATCGARNLDLLKDLGADEVLDYKSPDGALLRSPSNSQFDVVIHCATNIPWSTFQPVLASNGKVIDLTPKSVGVSMVESIKLTLSRQKLIPFYLIPNQKDLQFLVNLMKERKLKTIVDSKFVLAEFARAWLKSMDGHATGKIILLIGGEC